MIDIKKYAEAIKKAQISANEADKGSDLINDGGTCNFDSVMIDFKGIRETTIQKIAKMSGIQISGKYSGWWRGCCYISFNLNGQAANRTRMAEAAYKSLKADGIPVRMYYQAD